jgi:membrane protein implicated in regulation of membrane protease activity
MKIRGLWMGIVAIIVGVLVLLLPDLLRWILGIGLIVVGVLAVLGRR